ncbi:MAG: hypothetical protein J1F35_03870 [Erysipelotrichales bacterium]|nr:hypothetical protein [Erysipelotrichales bacterium]
MNNSFNIDFDKANICSKLLRDYYSESQSSAEVSYPSNLNKNSESYLIYIFYSCLLDYSMRSVIYHKNLIETYNEYPYIFNPKYVVDNFTNNLDELKNIIVNNIHPRYPNVAVNKWISLSIYLNDNQDLFNRIKSIKSFDELANLILSIKGYGQKTGGLLLRLIYESGISDFNFDLENIPIDRHDIEISYLNGVVNKKILNEEEINSLGESWVKAASINNVASADIDKYLWTVGNQFCNNKKCGECPLSNTCKRKV